MVMLAKRGRVEDIPRLTEAGYLWELKVDGVRCIADIDGGVVTLTGRNGTIATDRYPEVVAAFEEKFPVGRYTFDGEIAACDERGLPSWPLTHKRDAQQRDAHGWARRLPARYFVFDILNVSGRDIRSFAFANRRQILEEELRAVGGSRVLLPVLHSADGQALWNVVRQCGLEGMVAKKPTGQYRDGRTDAWIKIKRTSTVSCLVGGTDPGEGSRAATFGNLHLYLLDSDQQLVPVGKVGSGFSNVELRRVMHALHHPPTIVEVIFLDVSPDGQLRQPVFQRLRDDLSLTDCTLDQITTTA